jgi:3-hydroxy-3-methylglutaryl CoA synthase
VAAEIEAQHAISDEIIDVWRTRPRCYVAYVGGPLRRRARLPRTLVEAVKGLFAKTGKTAKDFTKAALYGPDARSHAAAAKRSDSSRRRRCRTRRSVDSATPVPPSH